MPSTIIDQYLDEMIRQKASDMYLTVGYPPSVRVNSNKITPLNKVTLEDSDIEKFTSELLDKDQIEEFNLKLELNISLMRKDYTRFRCNFLHQQQKTCIVIRHINTAIPTAKELGLPEIYTKMIMKKRGLIILASPGGSGKSTSMAALLHYRNSHSAGHILTIEDPIEFIHEHGRCIITQREVGSDTLSYRNALKNALRQRADVIAIGEIRDRESMDHALRFSETGHLCIATIHSNNASQAIDRMANLFPEDSRAYILKTISQNLLSIFSQRLVENMSKGLSLTSEILLNEGLLKTLIADDKLNEIYEAMEKGNDVGMRTFDNSLIKLHSKGIISMETALAESDNPSAIKLKINQGNLSPVETIQAQQDKEEEF